MAVWDIDPQGVHGVWAATEGVATEFDAHGIAFDSQITGAQGQSGSTVVAGELIEFYAAQVDEIGAVYTRVGACLHGVVQATSAYLDGDLEMAANAQAAASAAPDPSAIMPGRGPR